MATIPTGNFGQSIARPAPATAVQGGDAIGDAEGRLLQTSSNIAADVQRQQFEQQEARRRAQATLALATVQNGMHDAHDEVARGVLDGSIPTDKAPGILKTQIGKLRDTTLNGYTPDQRDLMAGHLAGTEGTLQRSLQGIVVKRQQQETASTIDQFGEQVSREAVRQGPQWAASKFSSMVDFTGSAAGLNDAQKARLKQSFGEKVHATFYELAGTAALTNEDDKALGGLVQKLVGPEGDPLDPAKRAQLTHQLYGWQQSILAKRERQANRADDEARKQYNAAVDVFNKGTDIALGGGYFSPEFIKEMTTTASGTAMEKQVGDLIASQREVAGFASRSAPDRAAIIEAWRSNRATPGLGTDPLGEKLINAMVTMDTKLRSATDDNAWTAAQSAGRIQEAGQIVPGDPQSAVQVVRARMAQIGDVETWAGKKVSPLQPAEAEQVGKMVRAMPLDQAASMLAGMGAAIGDRDRVAALGKQLHDKDGSLGLAMLYANSQTTQGRYVAELVLRGDQALRDKSVMVDKAAETGWQGAIAKQIRGAYSNPEAEDAAIEASFKIAAAKYAQDGSPNIDGAVKLATGGIVERNGQRVPLPYGMTEKDFDQRIEGIRPPDLAPQAPGGQVFAGGAPLSLDEFVQQLPKATLVHAGQGLYNVRAGSTLVTNAAGQRITIKVNP